MELPRGMKDFEYKENANIEHIRNHFKKLSDLYGFSFMDPSPIELLSVLETKSGSAIRDEIYYFKDKGDREVALRFDFTVGLTRYASLQKSMRLPAKISAFGGVFRYDEPQKGRYRYFHQWDVEIYGKPGLESDAEIIELTSRLFDSLLLKDITIDINHRNLVESFINQTFDSKDTVLVSDMLRAIDKIQKKSKQEILNEFKDRYDTSKLEKILEFSQIKGTILEVESKLDTSKLQSWNELKQLFSSLENRGVANIRINFGIVRGLDYYSGMVFEVFDKNSKLGALAGGGRYDSLTKAFGREDI
ncbi:MAG: histidine--tRNA ligase, partial [Nitrosopumilales archaeon CG11_big_fil_rev_8_21_14_0_20_33_24]